jgi:NlpC/P60 family protein
MDTFRGATAARRLAVLAGVFVAALGLGIVGSASARTRALRVSVTPSGTRLVVDIRAKARSSCSLTIFAKRRSVGFGLMRLGIRGHGDIRWTVPENAPSGSWRFLVSCQSAKVVSDAKVQVILINHGSGRGSLVKSDSVQLSGVKYANAANVSTPSAGQAIVNAAASQAGRTYCWAGGDISGPTHGYGNYKGEAPHCANQSTVGFDCTGLTIYAAYQGTGGRVHITNHSSGQAATVPGTWITSEAALQPGDLVYFGVSRNDITHAAIYAGGGMIWDANTAFWIYGDGVLKRTLSSERSLGFIGAVRIAGGGSTTPTNPAPAPTPHPSPTPPTSAPAPAPTSSPLPALEFQVMNAEGGIYWRSGPDWNTAEATAGNGFYPNTIIKVVCYQAGAGNVPGSSDVMWEQANWVSGEGSGTGWINEHFINDGAAINQPSPGAPACPSASPPPPPPPPPQTWAETAGGVAHTWTNYANAGGTQGPSIAGGQTVAIACKLTGFRVADGNTWWYRIASSPWNGTYYVSADAFYNNGATSGSLSGTPFVDPAVANC